MIDQGYQAEIDRNLDAQQFGPKGPAAGLPTWQNFGAGAGGLVAGPLQAGATWADILKGSGETLAATGTYSKGGMFSTPDAEEQRQNDAAATKIALQGPDTHSEVGTQLRTQAKDYLPDPQATGKAGQILGGLTTFASQAIPAGMAGPPGLVALGVQRGVQKSADLEEQGVDQGTRTAAGLVSGTLDAASMVLPMTGTSRLIAAGKGAAGGVATSIAQTEAEKLILEHAGYDKLASTYDPFDPVSLALSGIVPAAFGGLHSPTTAKAPGAARAEPTHADVTLSPEEQVHSAQVEDSTIDVDIASLKQELGKQTDAGARQVLQAELDRLTARKAVLADPAALDAARVTQTAAAIDHSRLTPDDDIQGHEQHAQAVEAASDQIARGEPVEVDNIVSPSLLDERGFPRDYADTRGGDERFHGTSRPIDSLSDDYAMSGDSRNIYGQGFYTTDAADVAGGYMRKGRGGQPTLYRVNVADDVKLKNMDEVMSPETVAMLRGSMGDAFPEENHVTGKPIRTLREAFDEFRAESRDNGLTRDDVQEVFDSIRYNLEQEGYRGYQHEGGDKTGAAPHDVKIFWIPESDVRIQDARIADFAKAIDEYRASKAPEPEATKPNRAAVNQARTEREAGATAPPKGPRETSTAPEGAAEHPGPEAAQLDATTAEILRTNPDLMVQLDGMEPMRAADLLEAVRQQAAEESRDASLLEVAAQCAISL